MQRLQQAALAFRAERGAFSGGYRTHDAVVRDGAIALTPYTFVGGERTAHAAMSLQTVAITAGGSSIGSGPASANLQGGTIELQRGPVVEQLANDVDGLHQQWVFASSPGSGDLVVEVAVANYAYATTTNGGIHFAGNGAMVRYSHAQWSGHDGPATPIPAVYDASTGRIRVTVPARVVASTTFPAVLDPTVSAEVAVDSPVVAPTGVTQDQVSIAFGGGEYLAVWADARDSAQTDIWGARLASDGTLTDTLGIKIAASTGVQSNPAVTYDGTAFLVVWEDFKVLNGTDSDIVGAHVATDGTVTSIGTIVGTATSETAPNVASVGGGAALVTWTAAGTVQGSIVTGSPGASFNIVTGALVDRPSVAANPSGNYLVGYTLTNHLMGQFVTTAGALSGAAFTISAPPSGAQVTSDATFDGANYDVVWRNGADAKIYGTRVSTAGTVLDTRTVGTTTGVGGIAIDAAPAISFHPSISCISTECLVTYHDQRNFSTSSYDLFGQLLTLAFAKSGTELTLVNAAGQQIIPVLANNGSGFFMSWTDNRTLGGDTVYGATVSSAGALGTQADIATGNNRESGLTVGASGTNNGLFWRDSRGGPSIDYVRYDSTGTQLDATAKVVQAGGAQLSPEASADLGGSTLVVWSDTRGGVNKDIYGARVDLSTGTTLDTSGIAISTAANDQLVPAVASNGSEALVVWQDLRTTANSFDLYAALISSAGAITLNDIAISTATGAQDNPAVTWDAASSQFIVVWQDATSGTFQVRGARVDSSGTVLDPGGIVLVASANGQQAPAIASTASGTFAVWQDGNHLTASRLAGGSSLSVLDASGIALGNSGSVQMSPKVGLLGGSYLLAYSDNRAGNQDIYGQLVKTDGTLSGAEFAISTSTDDEINPTVAATGASSARVGYEAHRLDTSRAVSRVVTNAIESIVVTPANPTIPNGTTQQFTATATFSDGSTGDVTSSVTWTSSATTVATIDSAGLATSHAQGPTTITATSGSVSGSTTLTVGPPTLSSIAVTPANGSVAVGFKIQMVATGTFTDGSTQNLTSTVNWQSSNTAVATISNVMPHGMATGVSGGTVTITATQSGISGNTMLTVNAGVTLSSIAVTPNPANLNVGQKKQLKATGTFSDGSTQDLTLQVTWSSNNSAVATVGSTGVATGVSLGSATATATKNGVTGTATINVVPPSLTSITVTPTSPFIVKNATQAFTATGKFSDGSTQDLTSTATWASSNTVVATMAANVATGVAAGTSTISATSAGVTGSTLLTVTNTNLVSIAVTPNPANIPVGYKVSFVATGTFMDGTTKNVTASCAWTSSDTTVATITSSSSSHGLATVLATGTTTITASLNGVSGTATLNGTTATLTSIAVTPATNTITVGQRKQLHATGTFSDSTTLDITSQVTWSSSNPAFATVGTSGVVTGVAAGSATITATRAGVNGTASVTVN